MRAHIANVTFDELRKEFDLDGEIVCSTAASILLKDTFHRTLRTNIYEEFTYHDIVELEF